MAKKIEDIEKPFNSIREELLFICKSNDGIFSPQKVVEFARNSKTYLHKEFEWDDSKAAELYRIDQARYIIRMEFDIIEGKDYRSEPARLFVSLRDERGKEGGYRLLKEILSDEERTRKMLEQALREFMALKKKYHILTQLANLFEEIDKAQLLIFEEVEKEN